MTETTLEMWWPSPAAFDDLVVEDAEHGFDLCAPDNTELAAWLEFWNQDEEHHQVFNDAFLSVITTHALETLKQHGKTETVTDEQNSDREQTQEKCSG